MRVADFCRECSCRSGRTPCGARDWLRLETAIPSAPSHTPRLGVVEPVCCDLHLDLYIRSLDAHGVSTNASWGGRTMPVAWGHLQHQDRRSAYAACPPGLLKHLAPLARSARETGCVTISRSP